MKPARTIVLLANERATSNPAAAWIACNLARRVGAKLFVVHVARPADRAAEDSLPSRAPAYTALAALVARCATAGGVVTRANLRLGTADEEILAEAAEIGAGLIVVADRDCGPTPGQQGGELGERLARRAACPVLIVRDTEPGNSRARLTLAGSGATGPRQAGQQCAAAR